MDYFAESQEAISASLENLWSKVMAFVPELLVALIILIIGLILANVIGGVAHKLVELTKVDSLIKKIDATKKLADAGLKLNVASLIGWIVKWFLIIVTLIAVVDILNLEQVTNFLNDVARYLPNVIVAVVILAVGLVVGQFVYDVVEKSAKASHVTKHTADVLAALAKWSIIIFAVLAGLSQLGIAPNLIQTLFTGIVAGLALAFGLAFGLGGKDHATKFLDKNMKK